MTYNLMTVFGLILAVGLLVDGPIVITEFARAEQERGVRRRDSYINSSYTMFWPIIASALTTIAAFFPLLFWPDMLGQWLRVIPLTVIVVLSALLGMFTLTVQSKILKLTKRSKTNLLQHHAQHKLHNQYVQLEVQKKQMLLIQLGMI